MYTIIVESALFVALLAAVGALVRLALEHFTPLGMRQVQDGNRIRMEKAAELRCPVHGPHAEEAMVRLPSGERICPECYEETLHG
jgi:hypothetical protein